VYVPRFFFLFHEPFGELPELMDLFTGFEWVYFHIFFVFHELSLMSSLDTFTGVERVYVLCL
jgi:hypothetical protein